MYCCSNLCFIYVQAICVAIAVSLHYLFLAVFFIMLAEGIELLLYTVFVFHIKTHRETVALLIGAWGNNTYSDTLQLCVIPKQL